MFKKMANNPFASPFGVSTIITSLIAQIHCSGSKSQSPIPLPNLPFCTTQLTKISTNKKQLKFELKYCQIIIILEKRQP